MKQADRSLLAEGFELLFLDVRVRQLNQTLRLGLLEHQIPPLLFVAATAVYLLANPEKFGQCIVNIQSCVRAAIALKPSDERLEMCWSRSRALYRHWLVK